LLTLALSIVPFSSGVNKTDGARLWQFARHPEQARQIMALLGVQSEEAKGLRPREWSPVLFDAMMQVDRSNAEYPWCQLLASYRAFDLGADEEAMECLERALASSARAGQLIRHALYLEAGCSSALVRKNAANARAWHARAAKLRKPRTGAVQAGIAMCEGRYADALDNWAAARARVDRLGLDSGLIRFAKAKWAECEAECRARSVDGAVDNMEASA
jgi:tetratricopeptide (TPR) repeat protein